MQRYKSFSNVRLFKSYAKHRKINKSRRNKRTKRQPTKRQPTKRRLTKRRFGKGG
jgi:hypothetical protein